MADRARRRARSRGLRGPLRLGLPVALLVLTLTAPALAPGAPGAVEDPLVSRHLPPGSGRWAVRLPQGRTLLAERVDIAADGGLTLRRAGTTLAVRPEETLGSPPARRTYWLGTDHLGRDLAARLLHGWRNSLVIALGAALMALAFGCAVGLAAALGGGAWDRWLMRWTDVWRALPKLFVLLALCALRQPGGLLLAIALAGVGWTSIARLSRAEALALRRADFVLSARAAGCAPARIALVHLAPHLRTTLITLGLLQFGNLILLEAALSFVGAGLGAATPTLGGLVADAALRGSPTWWTVLFPGLAIAVASLACHWLARSLVRRPAPRVVAAAAR